MPLEEQLGVFVELQREGEVRHIGMSNVTVDELREAQAITPIATVQNRYSLADRASEEVLDSCESEGIGFIPWGPTAAGELARPGGRLAGIAQRTGATPGQLALAWLLRRSPMMLPIPGSSSVAHLEENVAAATVRLGDEQFAALSTAVCRAASCSGATRR